MSRKKMIHRIASSVLAATLSLSFLYPSHAASTAPAATEFPAAFQKLDSTLLTNANFDGESNFDTTTITAGKWNVFNGQVIEDSNKAHSGNMAVLLSGSGSAVDQRVELKPNTEYELKVWMKADEGKGARVRAFINGGEPKMLLDTDANCYGKYYQYTNRFTTPANTTYANVGVVRAHNALETNGNVYVDDFSIEEVGAPISAERVDATTITVTYPNDRTDAPVEADFTLTYQLEGGSSLPLPCEMSYDESTHTATLTHASVQRDQELNVTFDLSASGVRFQQSITLDASSDYVAAEIAEVRDLNNGSATVVLKQAPTTDLTTADLTISYLDFDGNNAQAAVTKVEKVDAVTYNVEFSAIPSREQDKTYTLRFSIGGSFSQGELTVTTTAGKTFYVDATNGNDNNDGTSPATAWQSIEKVNNTTFFPGSQILLKAGESWTGMLWPKGSGAEGSPIILSSYGTGDRPRILMDENANMTEDLMRIATPIYDRKSNQTFYLHNQSYWEISNIEFYNPGFDADHHVDPNRAFERGMYITAEDVGQIDHIYINNVYIHGFQGNNKGNMGKESGGIIFFVNANFDESKREPTWFNDIRITNCTIEDVGRSGFFLLSPWKTRDMTENGQWGGRWSAVNQAGEGSLGAFTPSTNIYIGSNILRRIDGDGIILQCMDGVVVEYNLVDEPCVDTQFAAGIFPYLVSNAVIRYNELSRAHLALDAQGVEVDALNENVAVIYNYSHQNVGGFVQFCTPLNLPSFDSYYAYNVSEGDAGYYALLYSRQGTVNCSVFNNTIYFDPARAVDYKPAYDKFFEIENSAGTSQSVAVYNNIFYRAGEKYSFRSNEVSAFNSMQSLASDNVVSAGGGTRLANNLFYNFDTSAINKDSAFYKDNLWDVDPLLKAPGTLGDGKVTALIAGDITSAWELSVYSLQDNSPALDAGRPIRDIYADLDDILGNPVDSVTPDLGCIQRTEQGTDGKVPIGKPTLSTSTLTYGEPLSTITLSGTMTCEGTPVAGSFVWETPDEVPAAGTLQANWIFTPENTDLYKEVRGSAEIQVNRKELVAQVASVAAKVFDGTTTAQGTLALEGAVKGETPTATGDFAWTSTAAGTSTVTVSNIVLTGNWGANYTVAASLTAQDAGGAIQPKALTEAAFEDLAPVVYNGKEQTPALIVLDELLTAEDYTVSYKDNRNVGTAAVVVSGQGNFTGSVSLSFEIQPAAISYSIVNQTVKIGNGIADLSIQKTATGVNNEIVNGALAFYSDKMYNQKLPSDYVFQGKEGDTVTLYWTFTPDASATNYRSDVLQGSVILTLDASQVPVLTVPSFTKTYDGQTVTLAQLTQNAKAYDSKGAVVEGTWSVDSAAPALKDSGKYTITLHFTPNDTKNYVAASISVSVGIDLRAITVFPQLSTNHITVSENVPNVVLVYDNMVPGEGFALKTNPIFSGLPEKGQAGEFTVHWANQSSMREEIEALSMAKNYAISYATTAKLTVVNAQLQAGSTNASRIEISNKLTAVPQSLAGTAFDTIDKIFAEMVRIAAQRQSGVTQENTVLYDIVWLLSNNNGLTWREAQAQDFLNHGGLTVLIPYPAGTNAAEFDFVVTHMLTQDVGGKRAGEVEMPLITKTENGLQFTLSSLSPVAVSWTEKTNSSGGTSQPNTSATPEATPPQTGDTSGLTLWIMSLTLAGAITAAWVMREYRVRKKHTDVNP